MTMCKTDSGEHHIDRELGSGLRDGPGQDGGGREAPEGGDLCAHMFDSCCCMAETNTTS